MPVSKPKLIDMPVSNNGARVRMVIYYKEIEAQVDVVPPADFGGLKTSEYLALNPQGKMPALVADLDGLAWAESDTIARYFIDRFTADGPPLVGQSLAERTLCNALSRHHDAYLQPIQGCMYKAAPPFGAFGSRRLALAELEKQLRVLEELAARAPPGGGPYLAGGAEPTLADCTVFPTLVFCDFMLPRFFGWPRDAVLGPTLSAWWAHMTEHDPVGARVHREITDALAKWADGGRWTDILLAGRRDAAPGTIFDKILANEVPSTKVYEDDLCLAFKDINPVAPTHILLIPKHRDGLTQLRFATDDHKAILGHLMWAAAHVAKQEHLEGFRVVVNDGAQAAQSVFHLHVHVIGGRAMAWPPG